MSKGKEVAVKSETTVLKETVKIRQAELVDVSVEVSAMTGLPAEFGNAETLAGFPPSPKFEKVGDAVFGYYIRMQTDVGPYHSRLYELSVPRGSDDPLTIAVWGTSALDRLFDSAFPAIEAGDKLAIIFLGEKPTKRGLNPVKLYALKVARAGGAVRDAKAV